MNLINEQEIFDTWMPVVESKTSIEDPYKKKWLSKYCHTHSINESVGAHIGDGVGGFQTLGQTPGMGRPVAPTRGGGFDGSGDKFPSLLPLAIQVAAKTVGFDIVPVIPLPGPTGVLTYLDYVYAGGKVNGAGVNDHAPLLFKVPALTNTMTVGDAGTIANGDTGADQVNVVYVGTSRIDGEVIFKVDKSLGDGGFLGAATALIDIFDGTGAAEVAGGAIGGNVTFDAAAKASLVSALEDHVAGFTGAGDSDTDNWGDNFSRDSQPMTREIGEETYYRMMGLQTFTQFVEAKTHQVGASVTTEQIQDLNKQFGIDVVSMVENALVNEVSQSINKDILKRAFALGSQNAAEFTAVQGVNLALDLNSSANYQLGSPAVTTYENQMTIQRRLYSRILLAANVVANRGRRGPANFMVVGPMIASALQDLSGFTPAPFANTFSQNGGALYPVGSMAGMTVYVDQYMSFGDNRVLIGRKGGDDEPGLKFMPYMMAESIQTIAEATMSPKVVVKSRYALVEAGFHPQTMYVTFDVTLPTQGIV